MLFDIAHCQDIGLFTFYRFVWLTDIEAQIRDIQLRRKEVVASNGDAPNTERIALGEGGYYDRDIYGGGRLDGYVTSIAANDDVDVS